MNVVSAERAAICRAFDEAGPDSPTLCAGWDTRDLLSHLLVRERRPWTSLGFVVPALSPMTEWAVQPGRDASWPDAVALLRGGPPWWSPTTVPVLDSLVNTSEFVVHHEDVRRGRPGWCPRPAEPERDAQMWALLRRAARWMYRRSPVGVKLRTPSGGTCVARPGFRVVTVTGPPVELVLHAFGRDAVLVEMEGVPADVTALASSRRGV